MKEADQINLRKLVRGDREAWETFADRFTPVIYSAVRKTFLSYRGEAGRDDVEDVVQEVFLRLVRGDYRLLKTYDRKRSSPVTWLSIVARSAALDSLRRRKPPAVPLEDRDGAAVPPRVAGTAAEAIPPGILTPRQELILHLLFDRGLDPAEIGALLGISPQTVRSARHKALKKLRGYFRE